MTDAASTLVTFDTDEQRSARRHLHRQRVMNSKRFGLDLRLADYDARYVAAQDAAVGSGGESGNLAMVRAARDEVIARIGEEDSVLAAQRRRLRD